MNKHLKFFVSETRHRCLHFKRRKSWRLLKTTERWEKARCKSQFFEGLGCLQDPYHIEVDPNVAPVVNPARKVPVAIKDRVKAELEEMEKKSVIREVDVPTHWVNSVVIVEKPGTGKLRICLDTKHFNYAIKREHYQLPTVEDSAG